MTRRNRPARTSVRPGPPPSLNIDIAWRVRAERPAATLLRRIALQAARAAGFRQGTLSVAVVGATAMTALHRRYTGQPGPTDVLSFDLGSDRRRGRLEGEVVLCATVARKSAGGPTCPAQRVRAELALYLVHGILHLAGYDDHSPDDFARMHAREDELLTAFGLGPVFAGDR